MSFFQSLAAAFKGEAVTPRVPLGRSFISPWIASAEWHADQSRGPINYPVAIREAYLKNPVAQRAVRLVAEGIGGAPVTASDPELLALVSERSAGQPLLETLAAHLMLHGNGYVQVLRDADGHPVELFALRPERVTILPDAGGWPAAFAYKVGEKAMRIEALDDFGRPNLIHVRHFHPLDDHYGAGCLEAADEAVAIHNAAARWNRSLLENAARPSGALVYDPGEPGAALSSDQFERIKGELTAAYAGQVNAGRPMLLEGGLKWQSLSLTPADMDFATLKAAAARDIALAFGVPPMLLGIPGDNTYANYREANRALWRLTLLPVAGKILSAIAEGLSPWFRDARLVVDLDAVPALAEDRERLWTQVSAATFLSDDEKRAMLGIGEVRA
ncbi:HK97 family phage portal protein [Novosphingobium hassiacum]|uniref:HK97 family phage portal protein n=1 Tax=Novosphingobium hassiacum TaxID=173676 RepID=A0A7W6A0Q4_9SPHN|nr:phage portal protein [Novosphingobium hassiacum]MBB3862377.1 HK97 family phage portal protein [Novosphingobium hassiacum]